MRSNSDTLPMELRRLRYFVAVAETLNFTRAAKRLGIQQPPLSVQIQQLEKELGTPLFHRDGRGITLTNAGKLLCEEARVILKQVARTQTDVRRRGRGETGRINIGSAGGTYFHPLIPAIVCEYGRQYPDITVTPEANNTSLLVARLHAGKIDIAFIRPPIRDRDGLVIEPLVNEEMVMVLPTAHRLSALVAAPLKALAKETLVLPPRTINAGYYDAITSACRRAGFDPILNHHEAPQLVYIIPLVAAGLGVSIVPRSTSRIQLDGVLYLPIEGDAPRAEISVAYRYDERSPVVKNFVAVACQTRLKAGQPERERAA